MQGKREDTKRVAPTKASVEKGARGCRLQVGFWRGEEEEEVKRSGGPPAGARADPERSFISGPRKESALVPEDQEEEARDFDRRQERKQINYYCVLCVCVCLVLYGIANNRSLLLC